MLGYDLKTMNTNSESLDKMNGNHPDAILVRKVYGDAARRKQKRKWMLKRLIEGKHQASVSLKKYSTSLIKIRQVSLEFDH